MCTYVCMHGSRVYSNFKLTNLLMFGVKKSGFLCSIKGLRGSKLRGHVP